MPTETQPVTRARRRNTGQKTSLRVRVAKQRLYLETLERHGNELLACKEVGVSIRTVQIWAVANDSFKQKREEAQQLGDLVKRYQYENKLDLECLDDKEKFNKVTAILAMFRMKRLDTRYRDNSQVNVLVAGPGQCIFEPVVIPSGQTPRIGVQPDSENSRGGEGA